MKGKLPLQLGDSLVLPVIAAPMFLVSSPELVIESCAAGIVGSFPLLNARTTEILDGWMYRITAELEERKRQDRDRRVAPWAVNLIVHHTNKRYEADVELIKKHKPPIVITSLGDPQPIVSIVHNYGGHVFSDVSTVHHARKAAEKGVDGLILVCNGAGGHAGTINPIAFMGEVRKFWDGITILAGCISRGRDILAAQAMGADFAYMGTRFIASTESFASEDYQQMLIDSNLEDLIYTDAFSGVKANYLVPSIQKAGLDVNQLQKKEKLDFSFNDTQTKAWRDIWSAGQGVGSIERVLPVSKIVEELHQEYREALAALVENQG